MTTVSTWTANNGCVTVFKVFPSRLNIDCGRTPRRMLDRTDDIDEMPMIAHVYGIAMLREKQDQRPSEVKQDHKDLGVS